MSKDRRDKLANFKKMKDINLDMRTNVEYESFISVSYQDYKENYKK